MRELFQISYLSIAASVLLLLFMVFNSAFDARTRKAFYAGWGIASLMLLCNFIMYLYQGTGTHLLLLKGFSAVSYSVSGPVVLPLIALTTVFGKRTERVLLCLAAFNSLLSFLSMGNGCIFCYDAQGEMTLGRLALIPFGLSALYLGVLLTASIIKFRLGARSESAFILILSLWIMAAIVMNTIFGYKFLISGMAVLSYIFYYLFYTTQTLTRDAMTGAFNRHSFYKDIEQLKRRQMYVISMDLNGLKQINDTLGHDAGDKAIRAVSDSVFRLIPRSCRFYRMGGDEFEILYPGASRQDAECLIQKIKAAVAQQQCSVAAACCEHAKDGDFTAAFKEADRLMYEDKERMKCEKPR